MFKSIEYIGFDGNPELKANAEQLSPVLANEIRRWREDVEVRWSPHSDQSGVLDLTLSLTLPNGVTGTTSGTFSTGDLAETWLTRSRCRGVWSDLLGDLSKILDARIKEALAEPLEV